MAVDAKVVTAEKASDFRFFVDPGKHELLVGWSDDRSTKVSVDATAGGSQDAQPHAAAPAAEEAPRRVARRRAAPTSTKPLGPAVFFVGAGPHRRGRQA